MLVYELIARLQKLDGSLEVAILDGFNGGGHPRSLNFGPLVSDPEQDMEEYGDDHDNGYDYSDLNTPKGKALVVMGYGCY